MVLRYTVVELVLLEDFKGTREALSLQRTGLGRDAFHHRHNLVSKRSPKQYLRPSFGGSQEGPRRGLADQSEDREGLWIAFGHVLAPHRGSFGESQEGLKFSNRRDELPRGSQRAQGRWRCPGFPQFLK